MGGLVGRHVHGELAAVKLIRHPGGRRREEYQYDGCVREDDGCRDGRAMVCKEGAGGGPREAIPGGVMGGRRACVRSMCGHTDTPNFVHLLDRLRVSMACVCPQ